MMTRCDSMICIIAIRAARASVPIARFMYSSPLPEYTSAPVLMLCTCERRVKFVRGCFRKGGQNLCTKRIISAPLFSRTFILLRGNRLILVCSPCTRCTTSGQKRTPPTRIVPLASRMTLTATRSTLSLPPCNTSSVETSWQLLSKRQRLLASLPRRHRRICK